MTELHRHLEVKEQQPLHGKLAVVSGTSRGIGRAIARSLGEAGAGVVGSYVSEKSENKQESLGKEIEVSGGHFTSVRSDVTNPQDRENLLRMALNTTFSHGGIDILVLNAAGGFEKDKPYGWAEVINHHSQIALVEECLPFIRQGGEIVFITSHWAHGYGAVRMLPYYREIARTKKAAEVALLERLDAFADKGVRLSIISAPLVKGTGAYSIFEHLSAQKLAELETRMGGFPDADEVGRAVRDFILSPHQSGDIYYVRGFNVEPIPQEHIGVQSLNRQQIEEALPMYDNSLVNRVMVDNFESSEDRMSGTGHYTVRPTDCEGHFKKEYGGPILPAHLRLEIAAQTLGLVFKSLESDSEGLGTLDAVNADFTGDGKGGFIFLGDEIEIRATVTAIRGATDLTGRVEMYVREKLVTSFEEIRIGVIPDKEMALRVIKHARRQRGQI